MVDAIYLHCFKKKLLVTDILHNLNLNCIMHLRISMIRKLFYRNPDVDADLETYTGLKWKGKTQKGTHPLLGETGWIV